MSMLVHPKKINWCSRPNSRREYLNTLEKWWHFCALHTQTQHQRALVLSVGCAFCRAGFTCAIRRPACDCNLGKIGKIVATGAFTVLEGRLELRVISQIVWGWLALRHIELSPPRVYVRSSPGQVHLSTAEWRPAEDERSREQCRAALLSSRGNTVRSSSFQFAV